MGDGNPIYTFTFRRSDGSKGTDWIAAPLESIARQQILAYHDGEITITNVERREPIALLARPDPVVASWR